MRSFFGKTLTILALLFLSCALVLFAQTQTKGGKSKGNQADTTEIKKAGLPSQAEEIEISEGKISIRTKDGKKLILKGEEGGEEAKPEEKGAEEEIDLKNLEDVSKTKLPKKLDISPQGPYHEWSRDIVKMGSNVVVEEDERVGGDVVAIGGDVQVKGNVSGNVVAVGGNVEVFPTGVVEGDAVSVGGQVTKHSGATIEGQKVDVGFGGRLHKLPIVFPLMLTHFTALAFLVRIFKIVFFLFLGIVVISVVPKHVTKVKEKVRRDFLKSALVGLAGEILALPILIILIITIIGIPVAILVEPLLILAAVILGYTGTCLVIGEKLRQRATPKADTQILTLVIGVLAVEVVPLLARLLGLAGGFLSPFGWIATVLGWMIGYLVITVGFGASILTRLGTRPKDANLVTAPAVVATPGNASQQSSV
ncbi:MAG: polymer-forming cytoskeletal protein [Candidatus Zixiibacteriota bacterium]